ncbi:MAG: hypothetical protein IPH80_17020 [Myxococcales bacterium]|nr:hypothetical protein [Myxococcales bacterium]MBP6844932.1 hypothetical protein [Kofleriaceae bacterium]
MTTPREVESAVAKVLARQRRRRRLFAAAVIAALVIALLAIRCGGGFGLGGGDGLGGGRGGAGTGSGSARAPARCQIRVDATGVTVDGKPATPAAAVAACRGGADVVVTGDARQGTWDELARALAAAGVATAVRGAGAPVGVDAGP